MNDLDIDGHTVRNVHVYAGKSSPSLKDEGLSQDWAEDISTDGPFNIHWFVGSCGSFDQHPAISSSMQSMAMMKRKWTGLDVTMLERAFSPSGSFPNRNSSVGFNSYPFTIRNENAVTTLSPNSGPGTVNKFTYHRSNLVDVRYLIHGHEILNDVSKLSSWRCRQMYRHLQCTTANTTGSIPEHSLVTLNYGCGIHVDKNDCYPKEKAHVLNELKEVVDNAVLRKKCDPVWQLANNLTELVDEYDNPHPTVCCYQFVDSTSLCPYQGEVFAFFNMPGLGLSYRINDFWTNVFLAGVFSHGTSVPIFYEKDEVDNTEIIYMGMHTDVSVLAWGAKDKRTNQ